MPGKLNKRNEENKRNRTLPVAALPIDAWDACTLVEKCCG